MVEFLSSSVQVIEEPPSIVSPPQVPTAVAGLVGLTERGLLDTPTTVGSFDDFRRRFGDVIASAELPLTARQFFLNGGHEAVIVRILGAGSATADLDLLTVASAPTAGSILGSLTEPFDIEPGDTLTIAVDGGGPATATFLATAGFRTSVGTEPFALVNLDTLLVSVNGGPAQTVTFDTAEFVAIGAALAAEVAAVINAELVGASATVVLGAVKIISDRRGTSSSIEITGGTAAAAFAFPAGPGAGTGNVTNIDAVTVAEAKTVIEAAVPGLTVTNDTGAVRITSNTTGTGSSILVQAASTADDEFGFDNATHSGSSGAPAPTIAVVATSPGGWGNGLEIEIAPPTSGNVSGAGAEFNFTVIKDGVEVESFPNVTLDPTSAKYIETLVNHPVTGSTYVAVTDLLVGVTPPDNRPNGAAITGGLTFDLTGGSNGAAPAAADFTGGTNPDAGMNTLDVTNITLLAIPDQTTPAVQNEMITFCEVTRQNRVFAVLDPPASSTVASVRTHKGSLTTSESFALYWPRVKIANPSVAIFGSGETIVVPASGSIMGMMARNDAGKLEGPFAQPAGVIDGRLFSVLGVENEDVFRKSNRDLIYPDRINPISRRESGAGGIFVDGSRTGRSDGNFPSVGERRGVSFFERTASSALEFFRHRNNTEDARAAADRTVRGILRGLTRDGAFASKRPDLAFTLDSDISGVGINSAAVRAQNKFFQRVGLATAKPMEFIILLVSADTRALEEAA